MRSIEISHIKEFTTHLFAGTEFDGYLLVEAQFSTAATVMIDGHVNAGFLGAETMKLPEYREGFVMWKQFRPLCFDVIKGRKVPQQFKVVLKLPEPMLDAFLSAHGVLAGKPQVSGLFLNLMFRSGQLTCTTGIVLKEFSMDKGLEHLWDDYAAELLKAYT